ncbi:MAG TPA: SufD family Fe-S cluster assembly protein [Candidatus Nanoarchaeia archaeon]
MKDISLTLKENEERVLPLVWTLGSGEVNIDAKLAGRGAKLSILGALLLADQDELKVNISIDHIAPDTFSDTLIKSVLTERAQGRFYGLVKIKKGAKNTNTYFREDALLLSKKAKAEAIPALEIDENEVKAGHASTVGPVDPEQIFYLQSKGITQSMAKRMIVQGYFAGIIPALPEIEKGKMLAFLDKNFKI